MPKFPGVLLNNNPNAPSLDLNDLQVKGVGIFADVAERDALDVNIQTEGYLSVMKNDDNVYIYKGGGWTTPANWEKISGTIGFTDSDGNPLGEVSTLVFPEGSISIVGSSGVVAFTAGGTSTDTTNFNGVLSSADTTVQAALDTLDGLSLTLEGLGDTPSGYGTAGQVLISNGVDGFTFGSGSPWEEVAGTSTNIKYEDGTVGITNSAGIAEYTTGTHTQITVIKNELGGTFPGTNEETLLHLHNGNLAISKTSVVSSTPQSFITLKNGHHSATSGGYIGLSSYDMTLGGTASTKIAKYDLNGNIVSYRLTISSDSAPYAGGSHPRFGANGLWFPGGILGNPDMKITMGGTDSGLQFYTHTNSSFYFMGLGVEGSNQTSGVYLGAVQSGKVAYIRSSDFNTAGSYGYVGINVNTPTPTGPAFEVSSSYAKFNNGLHIGDITATGYAFPTATGTTGQVLKVDANGDLVFGDDLNGVWTADANGITYTAGNVGIGTASSSSQKLYVDGGVTIFDSAGTQPPAGASAGTISLQNASSSIILQSTAQAGTSTSFPFSIAIGSALTLSSTGNANIIMGRQITSAGAVTNAVVMGYNKTAKNNSVTIGSGGVGDVEIKGSSAGNGVAIFGSTTGSYAVAIGSSASAEANGVAIGHPAKAGVNSVSVGIRAGQSQTGQYNTAVGGYAGYSSGSPKDYQYATLVGARAGSNITSGDYNTSIGYESGYNVGAGERNVFLGYQAGYNETGSDKLYIANSNTTTPLIYGDFSDPIALINGDLRVTGAGSNSYALRVQGDAEILTSNSVRIGSGFGSSNNNYSVYIGKNVGSGTGQANNNVVIGRNAAGGTGAYFESVIIGAGALTANTAGTSMSVLIGYAAGSNGGNGTQAVGVGFRALMSAVGAQNTGIGQSAGRMAGGNSTFVGSAAGGGSAAATGVNNVGVGSSALQYVEGNNNTAVGTSSAGNLTTGSGNIAIGRTAGSAITTESYNTFIGYEAGRLTTSSYNTFIGNEAGESVTTALNVTAVGSFARGSSSTGSNSVMLGASSSATGSDAIALGRATANGNEAISIGGASRANAAQSIAVGYETQAGSTSIVIGNRANRYTGTSFNNVILGFGDRATFGNDNVSVGNSFIQNRDDSATLRPRSNVSLGHANFSFSPLNSYSNLVVGGSNFSNSGASAEIAYNAVMSSGLVGTGSPMRNTVIGQRNGTGQAVLGDDNVFLGYNAGFNETGSNKLYIANSNTTTPLIYGEFDTNHVKINGSHAGGAIGFWPGNSVNHPVEISDQAYLRSATSGGVSPSMSILFNSSVNVGNYSNNNLLIGTDFNIATLGQGKLILGASITQATTGSSSMPKMIIGNNIDLGTTNNNAGGIVIGLSGTLASNIGSGVVIGGDRGVFNGVAIKATSSGISGSQGGTVIMGEVKDYSVVIGGPQGAGIGQTSNGQKVIIGNAAGNSSAAHTAIGGYAAHSSTGTYITAVGSFALGSAGVGGGSATTAIGQAAGQNSTGNNNTFIGALAAGSNTTGGSNVAVGGGLGAGGAGALAANTTGSNNAAIGVDSLRTAVSASYNIAIGRYSGYKAGGSSNIFLGYRTAWVGTDNDTNITNNVVIGHQAGYNTAGSGNVFVGEGAGFNATGTGNVMLGTRAGYSETGSNRLYISSGQGTDLVYGEFDNDFLKVNGDLEVTGSDGLILNSPNGTRYKVTVSDAGVLSTSLA